MPQEPESGSRIAVEAQKIPEYVPPAVLFPYAKMGQSASGIACDESNGMFGPFTGQMFVADQTHSTVMRVYLEQVNGVYQGACFPFRAGFQLGKCAARTDQKRPICLWAARTGDGAHVVVGRSPWNASTGRGECRLKFSRSMCCRTVSM